MAGSFDENQVRKDGSIVGEIRGDMFRHEGVDIWKLDKGNLHKGTEVRWDGSIVGDVRSDGTVWWQGSHWGSVKPYEGTQQETMRVLTAHYTAPDPG